MRHPARTPNTPFLHTPLRRPRVRILSWADSASRGGAGQLQRWTGQVANRSIDWLLSEQTISPSPQHGAPSTGATDAVPVPVGRPRQLQQQACVERAFVSLGLPGPANSGCQSAPGSVGPCPRSPSWTTRGTRWCLAYAQPPTATLSPPPLEPLPTGPCPKQRQLNCCRWPNGSTLSECACGMHLRRRPPGWK